MTNKTILTLQTKLLPAKCVLLRAVELIEDKTVHDRLYKKACMKSGLVIVNNEIEAQKLRDALNDVEPINAAEMKILDAIRWKTNTACAKLSVNG